MFYLLPLLSAAAPPPPSPPPLASAMPPPAAPPLVVALAGFRLPTPVEVATGPPCQRWLSSQEGGPVKSDPGFSHVVRCRHWAPRWPTRFSMPPRTGRLTAVGPTRRPDAPAGPLLCHVRNGPSGRHGRTEETRQHCHEVFLSGHLACA